MILSFLLSLPCQIIDKHESKEEQNIYLQKFFKYITNKVNLST